jgi:epsin
MFLVVFFFFSVRQKAKDISSLLMDDARLREERSSRTQMRDRMAGVDNIMADFQSPRDRMSPYERPPGDRGGYRDEDSELRRALDESKRLAEEGSKKKTTEYVKEDGEIGRVQFQNIHCLDSI